jgi:hypothetical protein
MGFYKILATIFSYEAYLAVLIDFTIAIIGIITYSSLKLYLSYLEEFLELDCLDEFTNGKLNNFKVATDVVADKGLEIFVIVMTKIFLMLIGLVHECSTKNCKLTCKEYEKLIFGREDPNKEEEGEEGEGEKKEEDPFEKRKEQGSEYEKENRKEHQKAQENENEAINKDLEKPTKRQLSKNPINSDSNHRDSHNPILKKELH